MTSAGLTRRERVSHNALTELCDRGELFAVVDPYYQFPEATPKARLNPRDTDPEFYEMIAWNRVVYEPPFVIQVDRTSLEWILDSLAGERWGFFVAAKGFSIQDLQAHFQRFIIARGPDRNPYFFKFQDASVLEVFLRTWSAKELSVFFGGIEFFGITDLDSLEVWGWSNPFSDRKRQTPKPEDCLFTLRDEQLSASSGAIDQDLAKIISWHLRSFHWRSVQFLSKEVLERRVAYGIRCGRKYELQSLQDLAGFVSLMFEIAPNFDQHPSFQRILADAASPFESKLQRLAEKITEREWEEAVRMYDRRFWARALQELEKAG